MTASLSAPPVGAEVPLPADRWSDLAIASLSLEWNFGAGWQDEFFAAYGVEPDHQRIQAWCDRGNSRPNADSEPASPSRPTSPVAP